MGLNWPEGLKAAGRGLELIATRQIRREELEYETARAENFERLRHRLATERDAQNAAQSEGAQTRLFAHQDRAQGERERAADERAASRDATQFRRQSRLIESQENREDYRTARASEVAERNAQRQRLEDAQRSLERAIADEAEHVSALEELGEPIEGIPSTGIARRNRLLQDARRRRALAQRDVARYSQRGMPAPPRRQSPAAFGSEDEQNPFRRGAPLIPPPGR